MEIKKAFRKLALIYHPDRHSKGGKFMSYFLDLQEAYEVLSDPMKRRKYDEEYVFHFGSLNTNYVNSASAILQEFMHLSQLSNDYDYGGYPKTMITDYFRYMLQDPHPLIIQEHLEGEENWDDLGDCVIDVVSIMHYLDVKELESQFLQFLKPNKQEEYYQKVASMKRSYRFQLLKPWLVLLFSAVFLYFMYHFA